MTNAPAAVEARSNKYGIEISRSRGCRTGAFRWAGMPTVSVHGLPLGQSDGYLRATI